MTNKLVIFSYFLLYLSFSSNIQLTFAQNNKKNDVIFWDKNKHVELGLNVTTVISSFVGTESTAVDPGDFPLSLKITRNHKALRLGLGARIRFGGEDAPFNSVNTTGDNSISLRVGYEWRYVIGKRWLAYFGVDGLVGYQRQSSRIIALNDFADISQTDLLFGVGPVYGIQLAISRRMMLGTEGSIYAINEYSINKQTFETNTFLNESSTAWGINVNMTVPQWLYLIVRF